MWYGGGIGNNRNASVSVGHLSYMGFIFPKLQSYEYQNPFKRSRNQADEFLQRQNRPAIYGESPKTGQFHPRTKRDERTRKHPARNQIKRQFLLAQRISRNFKSIFGCRIRFLF